MGIMDDIADNAKTEADKAAAKQKQKAQQQQMADPDDKMNTGNTSSGPGS